MAGLQEAFQNAAAAAMSAAGDLKESVTLRVKASSNPTYNPTTDSVSDSYTDYTVNALPSGYRTNEIDGSAILNTDEKLQILVADLPTGVEPKREDQVVRNSVKWEVESVHKDPADALWTLQVRRP